ncbi:small RNA 2'-O-methyltransferase [Periophthalmus magnuspinnatus]|uniref:small RNA 2'-O-methyltransferase n=1 Tax=Periophthalmus magnuspinnatus TaxID=409849 RepID=UPI002436DDC8|nr:small RNA 2'-O-methyltransferase [Periophthalmus magnuspinnatus]
MEPFFNPPLHKQRHQFVIDFIKKYKTKKVMDLGCSECTLLKRLKFHREIEHLVGVDINGAKVKKKMHALAPLSTDYLQPGFEQLCVELYQGSVTEPDARLRGFHLAVSIELIEHLLLPDVERFSEVLFGYMAPVHVIISTPNSEFNPLFPGLTGFRHPDHKFEWTRAQFQSWAQRVCVDFEYEVEITGVGLPPGGGLKQFGFCSQIAVFHRLKGGFNISPDERSQGETSYTLLHRIIYPSLKDNNVLRRVLLSEVLFWAEELKRRSREREEKEEKKEKEETWTKSTGACGEERPPEDPRRSAGDGESNGNCAPQRGCVAVPLSLLWASSPRVVALSGSLSNLRLFLMDEPMVKLSQDKSALLLQTDEEVYEGDLEDCGYTEIEQNQSVSPKTLENWEED